MSRNAGAARAGPELGEAIVKTVRHFFPDFNYWLDDVPDTRFHPYIVYHKRFLLWWGSASICFSSAAAGNWIRPRCPRYLRAGQPEPVGRYRAGDAAGHKTLHHFLGHTGAAPYSQLAAA